MLVAFFSFTPFLFAFQEVDFQYVRSLEISGKSGLVKIELDKHFMQNSNYEDITLVDQNNQIVPTKLINRDLVLLPVTIASSTQSKANHQGKSFVAQNLLDGDLQTIFEVEGQEDVITNAEIIFDLGSVQPVRGLSFDLKPSSKLWGNFKVSSSTDKQKFTEIKTTETGADQKNFALFPTTELRYLKVVFSFYRDLTLSELRVFGTQKSFLTFNYDPQKQYKLFYGSFNPQINSNHKIVFTGKADDLPNLKLTEPVLNVLYNSDFDGDGIENSQDNCPQNANSDQADNDQDGVGDICDLTPFMRNKDLIDLDQDGVGDLNDNCPFVKNVSQADSDGNGIGDICDDQDKDTLPDFLDNCPTLANYDQKDTRGLGVGDVCRGDYDQDGIQQIQDNCPEISNPDQLDTDGDGVGDACDNCSKLINANQIDLNQNKIGDACEDQDNDGLIDTQDNCKMIANIDQIDTDGDGAGDACDNCVSIKNASQWDDDNDGIGNECDDDDGDGILNLVDNCPSHINPDQKDSDNDGDGDVCIDTDNDEIIDASDNCPKIGNPDQADEDKDGIGDLCDPIFNKPQYYNYAYWGVIGLIGAGFVYYLITLVLQIVASKKEKKK